MMGSVDVAGQAGGQSALLLRDGLYSMEYYIGSVRIDEAGKALAVLRDGNVLGSDAHGGVFEGRMARSQCGGLVCVLLVFRVPPGGFLVSGRRSGGQERLVDVTGLMLHGDNGLRGLCEIDGQRVGIRFGFVGPLPDAAA